MNGAVSDSGSKVMVERLSCTYLVSREHPAPDAIRPRLDALVRADIVGQCRALLPAVLNPDDPSVWCIRRLDVDVGLNVLTDSDQVLARAWGQRIVDSLAAVVQHGPRLDQVVRFADRAEYLASFARDLARGGDCESWYYAPFAGLRGAPTGSAIADVITREPDLAEDVLLWLDRWGELERVLDRLSDRDAEVVWALWGDPNMHRAPPQHMLDVVLAIWPAIHGRGARAVSTRSAIHTYVAAHRHMSAIRIDADLPAAIDLLRRFAGMLAATHSTTSLVDAVATGDLRAAVSLVHASSAGRELAALPALIEAGQADRAWLAGAARVLAPHTAGLEPANPPATPEPDSAITAYGGIFLLLPVLLDLQFDRLLAEINPPEADGVSDVALLRHLLAVACFGRERAVSATLDPVLARVSGLPGPPTLEAIEQIAALVTAGHSSATCLRYLARAMARQGRIGGRCLAAEVVTLPFGGEVLVIKDTQRDVWLHLTRVTEDCGAQLPRALAFVAETADVQPAVLVIGDELHRRLGEDPPAGWPHDVMLLRPGAPDPPAYHRELVEYRARVHSAAEDLSYLSLAGLPHLGIPAGQVDLTLVLLARAVLRGLATRLLGFEWSSCAYIYHNFLAGISTIRYADGWIAVELGRPPLHVILWLAGIEGQVRDVPWLNGTSVSVTLAEG